MPDAGGRFRGISLAGIEIPWLEHTPESFADAVACVCAEPCDLCVESDGKCARGEDCRCKQGESAEPGW